MNDESVVMTQMTWELFGRTEEDVNVMVTWRRDGGRDGTRQFELWIHKEGQCVALYLTRDEMRQIGKALESKAGFTGYNG